MDQLVPVPPCDLDRVRDAHFPHVLGRSGHPRLGLIAPEDAELEGAAPGNAAELRRKLFVVLEFEPVDEAVPVAVGVHRLEELFAVELRQNLRPEPGAEGPVAGVQLRS